MQEDDDLTKLNVGTWDLGLAGIPVDDRGSVAIDFIQDKASSVFEVWYNENEMNLRIDNSIIEIEDLEDYFKKIKLRSIILEATTLGFAEIFLISNALLKIGFGGLSFLYVEPRRYNRRTNLRDTFLLHKRDFELSDEFSGYKGIPGATLALNKNTLQRSVFFLGFEEARLDLALENFPINPSLCSIVFGIPAFKPGWEMDSLANNIRVIKEKKVIGGVHFCGAENPAAAFKALDNVYKELTQRERLFIGPIGTKPHGIGAALFVALYDKVGILYDHPIKSTGRSNEVGKCHLYEVILGDT